MFRRRAENKRHYRQGLCQCKAKKNGIGLVILAATFIFVLAGCSEPDYPGAFGGEMRDTMSPGHFIGKTGMAYKAARENRDLLDKIYCYCRCQDNHGHKSLLTCFVDRHGSQCGVCMDEALMASDLRKKGYNDDEVVEKINARFSKRPH